MDAQDIEQLCSISMTFMITKLQQIVILTELANIIMETKLFNTQCELLGGFLFNDVIPIPSQIFARSEAILEKRPILPIQRETYKK